MNYRDYFDIDPDYFPQVDKEIIETQPDLWKKFYPHPSFVSLLKATVSVLKRKQKLSLWVDGAYGTGKSHAVLTLKKLLEASEEDTKAYFNKYGLDNYLCAELTAQKNSGNILVCHRYGSSDISNDTDLIVAIQEGIEKAINSQLFLIQGPPGTGKTVTSAAIVYHLANLNVGKVLVCAPSNIAADQLSEKIEKIGLKVVRVCAKSRESISTRVEHLSLHNQLRRLDGKKEYKKFFEMLKRKEEEGNVLSNKDHEKYKKLKKKAEEEIINSCQVVVTTCISSFDKRLNNFRFPIVLIDEATQACESECILPLLHGAEHAIIVGDHCQLGPVVLCKNAAKAGLKMSLFERLVKLKIKPHMLQVQYRMHPKLSEFPSNTFYDGNLQNGVTSDDRIYFNVNFPWPNPKKPTFFYHIVGQEEFSA